MRKVYTIVVIAYIVIGKRNFNEYKYFKIEIVFYIRWIIANQNWSEVKYAEKHTLSGFYYNFYPIKFYWEKEMIYLLLPDGLYLQFDDDNILPRIIKTFDYGSSTKTNPIKRYPNQTLECKWYAHFIIYVQV